MCVLFLAAPCSLFVPSVLPINSVAGDMTADGGWMKVGAAELMSASVDLFK